ncbi:hypothetical protein LZQ00_12345 [Sphingobacterium sp. SRCM116780]|uniref:DUF6620 family protein n=1 Tax=Sphingobacterium sp. SRCM116780 TaxID=2907623 RepID=UPI001F418192|nr:DUF6620 family protein [Sphingobacterium sp. SRCM116780]UIR55069.1 hypothetical protein LZQ00_12345 [Sphingobacterium sp. SRCM116780]
MSNPLLEPIHGVSLYDYATVSAKIASGIEQEAILKALGIENAIYEEASALWITRMQEDKDFVIITEFGKHYANTDNHPKLKDLKPEVSAEGAQNLEKLKSDRHFYEELCGARIAAYQYGYDGSQWILDNYGITLGEFQNVAMQWAEVSTAEAIGEDVEQVHYWSSFQQQKQAEYAQKFASEQGGNIGDDVEF